MLSLLEAYEGSSWLFDFQYLENYDVSCSHETVIPGIRTREKLFLWYNRRSLLCNIKNNVFSLSLNTAMHFKEKFLILPLVYTDSIPTIAYMKSTAFERDKQWFMKSCDSKETAR